MSTTRELIERRALFDAALAGTDLDRGGMDPLVAEALAAGPSDKADPVLETAKAVAAKAAAEPPVASAASAPVVSASDAAPAPPVGPAIPAPQTASTGADTFYDMLLRNDAYRLQNKEAFERNERANAARVRIAAVADALASLGNLVGTTAGSENQPQTYQTPFVAEQVEAGRKEARALAKAIEENQEGLQLAKMKLDASNASYDRQLAVQDAITQRAVANALARAELEKDKHGYRTEENAQKAGFTKEQHDIDNAVKKEIAEGRNATSRANTAANVAQKDRVLDAKKNGEISDGNVGSYTTETVITRDDAGHEVGRTTRRTGSNGQTTTTTSGRGGSQGGSGSSGGSGGGAKTPPSKRKKDQSKTPPSKR